MHPVSFHFESVSENNPLFAEVGAHFKQIIQPIYGDQSQALEKIGKAQDRRCEVLLESVETTSRVAGILVYKTNPTDEFESRGAPRALEIKTLFVVNAAENSGRGIGSQLWQRVEEVAKTSLFSSVVVTVSETKGESLAFFKKKGFSQVAVLNTFEAPELVLVKQLR